MLHYHLFFLKEYIVFSNVYISVNTVFECCYLFFVWEIGHPLSTCAKEGMEGVIQNMYRCIQGEKGYQASCVRTHLQALTLFIFLSEGVLSLSSFKKGVFCQKWFCCRKISFFTLNCFSESKLNSFNLNQIEP